MKEEKTMLKIITLGDSNVGKTSLFYHYVNGEYRYNRPPSIGPDYFIKELKVENKHVFLMVWDTCGQERFQAFSPPYFRGANCYTLCFDIHNEESFINLGKWMDEIIKYCYGNIPFVLVGTKSDIPRTDKSISKARIEQWCKNIEDQGIIDKVHYFETSAKLSQNVTELYNVAAKLALEHYSIVKYISIIRPIGPPEEVKVGTCC
ncbi:GTP binding protein RARE7L [Dictyostelium discoideum AX4]|uniref:Ras-related protein RabL n=2 Tax=Dictyostelium discoideum TaxID=44689 RepID=RABL_DICDI|nr:GTP binding protein RARE7L [Dictyostelium discoideum AX4]Q54FK7.1 RecName: Full=Ras-related protein RabL [Dictyostelium discoideum]EAL62023.1 GTP binding protein RARE7L [Dictyostelium discoideum AX4]|eukprot:XP_635533.1 GTP binding protein RARE7L [Dictyostelium discoideum AX4]